MYNSLEAIVGRIQNELSGGRPVDDTVFDKQFIADAVHKVRALLIRQYFEQNKKPDQSYYQLIECLEITCEELECKGVKSGEKVDKVTLPSLIGASSYTIGYLGSIDLKNSFEERHFDTHDNGESHIWGALNPYFIRVASDARLYNLPTPNMKFISAVLLAADPTDIEGCDWTTEYPIPGDRLHKLELLVKQDLSSLMLQLPLDKQNNANPEKPVTRPSKQKAKRE
jgi:hypothetical protein